LADQTPGLTVIVHLKAWTLHYRSTGTREWQCYQSGGAGRSGVAERHKPTDTPEDEIEPAALPPFDDTVGLVRRFEDRSCRGGACRRACRRCFPPAEKTNSW